MIFQQTWPLVLRGEKTQTRRPVMSHDEALYDANGAIEAITANGNEKWRVGNTISVEPSREKPSVGRVEIVSIRRERVDQISPGDIKAEGFPDRAAFFDLWVRMHGETAVKKEVWVLTFTLAEVNEA
jgi:hypothetical protein